MAIIPLYLWLCFQVNWDECGIDTGVNERDLAIPSELPINCVTLDKSRNFYKPVPSSIKLKAEFTILVYYFHNVNHMFGMLSELLSCCNRFTLIIISVL